MTNTGIQTTFHHPANGDRKAITTSFDHPPVHSRKTDWSAYFTDDGADAHRYGYGATEVEAIEDLIENFGDEE